MSAANDSSPSAEPAKASNHKSSKEENRILKNEIKLLNQKSKSLETQLVKSNTIRDRLESLCRELQKQNKFIKAESSSKLQEAHDKGKELAVEVANNMGFMKSINENLGSITSENVKVRQENAELSEKIEILQSHFEKREEIIQSALKEARETCISAQTELAELKLKNAEEKEKLYKEMQQLSMNLVSSREQMKESKLIEGELRKLLNTYEEKFNGLQNALKETNSAYNSFRGEMAKVSKKAKELEVDTLRWRKRYEESNLALAKVQQNRLTLESELTKAKEGLLKMTELCRVLQEERKDMLKELKKDEKENKSPDEGSNIKNSDKSPTTAATVTLNANPTEGKKSPKSKQKRSPIPSPTPQSDDGAKA